MDTEQPLAEPMQEHIHVPPNYEDHIHQPAWNEPSRKPHFTELAESSNGPRLKAR